MRDVVNPDNSKIVKQIKTSLTATPNQTAKSVLKSTSAKSLNTVQTYLSLLVDIGAAYISGWSPVPHKSSGWIQYAAMYSMGQGVTPTCPEQPDDIPPRQNVIPLHCAKVIPRDRMLCALMGIAV